MENWKMLEDGGSNRWIYAREVAHHVWIFIRMDDMVEAMGKEATYWFHCDVGIVDLNQAMECGTLEEALNFCDAKSWMPDLPEESHPLAMAQCLFDSGAWSPLWQDGSPEIDKDDNDDWQYDAPGDDDPEFVDLLEAGRKWAEENLLDEESRDHWLDTKIVNRIGQTAREFAGGTNTMWEKLRQIKDDSNATPEQKIILKMYSSCCHTLDGTPIPEDIKEV
jgi:hypothetical protein